MVKLWKYCASAITKINQPNATQLYEIIYNLCFMLMESVEPSDAALLINILTGWKVKKIVNSKWILFITKLINEKLHYIGEK